MTAKDLFTVALRIIGIYFAVVGVGTLPVAIGTLTSLAGGAPVGPVEYPKWWSVAISLPPVIYCVAAIFLLVFAPRISAVLYADEARHDALKASSVNRADLYQIGVQLLGIYGLFQAIPAFANLAAALTSDTGRQWILTVNRTETIQGILYLAMSLYLIVGAKQIARWIAKLREFPVNDGHRASIHSNEP